LAAEQPAKRLRLTGTIDRFTFRNPDNGWAVARLLDDEHGRAHTIVGTLAHLTEGQHVVVEGSEAEHARFGKQLAVETCEAIAPSTVDGIQAYLASGLVKGIGPATAEKITKVFGTHTLEVIENDPDQLRKVRGLGERKIQDLVGAVRAQKDLQGVLVFLRTYGLGANLAARRRNVALYRSLLRTSALVVPEERPGDLPAWTIFNVLAERRDALRAHLAERGVETLLYYGTPLHLHPAAAGLGYRRGDFPVAEAQCDRVLALPHHPYVSEEQIAYVAEQINSFYG